MSDDRCQRCNSGPDPDLRTLHMACFYEMSELGLPFSGEVLFSMDQKQLEVVKKPAIVDVGGKELCIAPGKYTTKAPLVPRHQYTILVCKDCRADWMAFIKTWWQTPAIKVGCGSGIFVRENGTVVEISEEEWYRRFPGKKPVRVVE